MRAAEKPHVFSYILTTLPSRAVLYAWRFLSRFSLFSSSNPPQNTNRAPLSIMTVKMRRKGAKTRV